MRFFLLFIISIIGMSYNSYAQFLLKRVSIANARKYEADQNSYNAGFKKMKVSSDFFYGAQANKDYYPLTFKRGKDSFTPKCVAEYYYSIKDSVVNAIVYDWNIMNEVTNLKTDEYKLEQQVSRKDDYIKQYNSVRSQLITLLGQPSKTGEITESTDDFNGETQWDFDDKEVILNTVFTSKLKAVGPFKFGSFRVRLKVDWK